MKVVKEYEEFESWCDMLRDMEEIFDYSPFNTIPGEYSGTFKVTIEYLPEEGV